MTRARCMAYAFTVFALRALLSCAGVPTLCIKKRISENCFTYCNPHHPAHSAPQSTLTLSGAPKCAVLLASAGASKCLSYTAMKCICYSLVLQGQLLASAGAAKDNHAGKPSDLVHFFTTTNQSQFSTTWSALEAAHLDGPIPSSLPVWLRCLTIRVGSYRHRISHHGIRPATY